MSLSISSAEPGKLLDYANILLLVDGELVQEANKLALTLFLFQSSCQEPAFQQRASHLPDVLTSHARNAQHHDEWVKSIAFAFVAADLWGPKPVLPIIVVPPRIPATPLPNLPSPSKPYDRPRPLPGNMADLFAMLEDPKNPDITLVKIGPDEYIILVKGTRGGPEDPDAWGGAANTWPNNLFSGIGFESDYSAQLERFIEESGIPDGSKLHFVGHSQGGHAAQIAANGYAKSGKYEVASVTGYGTYYVAEPNKNIGVSHIYDFDNDPVGIVGLGLGFVGAGMFPAVSTVKSLFGHHETYLGKWDDQSDAEKEYVHGAYEKSGNLAAISTPWAHSASQSYEVVDTYSSHRGRAGLALITIILVATGMSASQCVESIKQTVETVSVGVNVTTHVVQQGWNVTTETAKKTGELVVDSLETGISETGKVANKAWNTAVDTTQETGAAVVNTLSDWFF